MKNILYRKIELIAQFIGWLQISGGVIGLISVLNLLIKTEIINGPLLLIFLTGIGLYVFSIYAGKKILESCRAYENFGVKLSLINHILQFFQWSFLGSGLSYSSNISVLIGVKKYSFFLEFFVLPSFDMYINSGHVFFVSLNIIAVLFFMILLMIRNKFRILKMNNDTAK